MKDIDENNTEDDAYQQFPYHRGLFQSDDHEMACHGYYGKGGDSQPCRIGSYGNPYMAMPGQ